MPVKHMTTFEFATAFRTDASTRRKCGPMGTLYATPVALDDALLTDKARRMIAVCDTSFDDTDDLTPEFGIKRRYPSVEEGAAAFGSPAAFVQAAASLRQTYGDTHSGAKVSVDPTYGPKLREGDDPHVVLNALAETPGLMVRRARVGAEWVDLGNGTVEPTENQARTVWGHMLRVCSPRGLAA